MPTASATAPNIGPRMAPKTAAPNAVPISSPRRSRGVATVSQASAPAQVVVLEKPWTNRASPSAQGPSAAANAKLETARRTRPATTGGLRPPAQRPRARRESRRGARRRRTRRRAVLRRSWRGRTRPRNRESAARAPRTASRRRRRRRRREPAADASPSTLPTRRPRRTPAAGGPEQLQGSWREEKGAAPAAPFKIAPKINSASRWRFRPLLRLTFRLPPTRPPVEPRPTRAPCSLQEGI